LPKLVFQDFDEFAHAINGVAGRFAPTAKSESDWWVQVAPVRRVTIQQVQTGGSTAFVGDGKDQFVTIGVPTTTPGHIHVDGRSLNGNGFILVNEGQPFAIGTHRPTRWAGISIPVEHPCLPIQFLHSSSRYSRACGRTHQQAALEYVSMTKALVQRLLSSEHRIDSFENAATRAAEEELLSIASRVLESAAGAKHVHAGRPAYSRSRVLARALELIEASHGRALFLQDICQAAQVSERTLRSIFQEYFGVGPMRLLKIIRLRDLRAELLAADPRERVWKVANRLGVWDLSMFAHDYKVLFGETPHQTLRSAPARSRDNAVNASWVRYASRKLIEASAQDVYMNEADGG
jgi:AraC family transcriptional regulator, ethanolamine operon transcriptional activator